MAKNEGQPTRAQVVQALRILEAYGKHGVANRAAGVTSSSTEKGK